MILPPPTGPLTDGQRLPSWLAWPCNALALNLDPVGQLKRLLELTEAYIEHCVILLLSERFQAPGDVPSPMMHMNRTMRKRMTMGDWFSLLEGLTDIQEDDAAHLPAGAQLHRLLNTRVQRDSETYRFTRRLDGSVRKVAYKHLLKGIAPLRNTYAHQSKSDSWCREMVGLLHAALTELFEASRPVLLRPLVRMRHQQSSVDGVQVQLDAFVDGGIHLMEATLPFDAPDLQPNQLYAWDREAVAMHRVPTWLVFHVEEALFFFGGYPIKERQAHYHSRAPRTEARTIPESPDLPTVIRYGTDTFHTQEEDESPDERSITLRLIDTHPDDPPYVSDGVPRMVAIWPLSGPAFLMPTVVSVNSPLWVGRDEGAAVWLDHPSVSRRHALLTVEDNGTIWIEDRGSTNGTKVNDGPRFHGHTYKTPPGVTVWFGHFPCRLARASKRELAHQVAVCGIMKDRDSLLALQDDMGALVTLVQEVRADQSTLALCSISLNDVQALQRHVDADAFDAISRSLMRLVGDVFRPRVDRFWHHGPGRLVVAIPQGNAGVIAHTLNRLCMRVVEHRWAAAPNLHLAVTCAVVDLKPFESATQLLQRVEHLAQQASGKGGVFLPLKPRKNDG